jgi:hypothetical protein
MIISLQFAGSSNVGSYFGSYFRTAHDADWRSQVRDHTMAREATISLPVAAAVINGGPPILQSAIWAAALLILAASKIAKTRKLQYCALIRNPDRAIIAERDACLFKRRENAP